MGGGWASTRIVAAACLPKPLMIAFFASVVAMNLEASSPQYWIVRMTNDDGPVRSRP